MTLDKSREHQLSRYLSNLHFLLRACFGPHSQTQTTKEHLSRMNNRSSDCFLVLALAIANVFFVAVKVSSLSSIWYNTISLGSDTVDLETSFIGLTNGMASHTLVPVHKNIRKSDEIFNRLSSTRKLDRMYLAFIKRFMKRPYRRSY